MKASNIIKGSLFVSVLLFLSIFSAYVHAEENAAENIRKPVIALQQTLHHPHDCESDMTNRKGHRNPSFVLYDDGLVILQKDTILCGLYSAKLAPDELNTLLKNLNIDEAFMALEERYFVTQEFHPPINSISYWNNDAYKKVVVFGDLRLDEEARRKTPSVFLNAFDSLSNFNTDKFQPWEPEHFVLWVAPQSGGDGDPVEWPKKWPDIQHASTRPDSDFEGKYFIYLPGAEKEKFTEFFSTLVNNHIVLINEKTWYIYPLRHILPGEKAWAEN